MTVTHGAGEASRGGQSFKPFEKAVRVSTREWYIVVYHRVDRWLKFWSTAVYSEYTAIYSVYFGHAWFLNLLMVYRDNEG